MTKMIFLTGASSVGKTSTLDYLKRTLEPDAFAFYAFDSIQIPSLEEMTARYGSPGDWQKAKTFEWIERLIKSK